VKSLEAANTGAQENLNITTRPTLPPVAEFRTIEEEQQPLKLAPGKP